ncbi:chromosomal replication initiator protein DnaA [Leptospira sp. GIMC2001]|uniref:chromosomal replication initiator protein DnaA n=1 Tax=Leptospira sp. GIMC2001 TaxID=1513297 RepID=UPI00234AEFA9|nr:chromosomal replication initiator protein DnaA [Leptospira sp. GIMC2001]WCL51422.1 chromosomal replication initiator protein DnaA [Leptospira sp. GIMC2001]
MSDKTNPDWNLVLNEVSKLINPKYYHSFISPLHLLKIENSKAFLIAPSDQVKRHVESKYITQIEEALFTVLGDRVHVEILTESKDASVEFNTAIQDKFDVRESFFNPDYSFENFIVADSNRLPYTACMEAVKRPGDINPLYIFGSVGVGKTHLLHAIGNEILKREPWKKVRYVEMTSFLNEFVYTVRQNSRTALDSFKLKFQSYDTLLIDDIQFLNSGADKTQEEFFALFNFLYQRKSQIVIASDRPSYELPIHDRLKSRFTKGVQANVQPPSPDLRRAILSKYSDLYNLHLDEESLNYTSSHITGDIRHLMGALNDILLYKKAYNLMIVPFERVKEVVDSRSVFRQKAVDMTQDNLIELVCEIYNQPKKDVLGKSRKNEFILPRHLCMYMLKEIFSLNKTLIGRIFDCKHTTVIHAISNIEEKIKTDLKLQETVHKVRLKFDLI